MNAVMREVNGSGNVDASTSALVSGTAKRAWEQMRRDSNVSFVREGRAWRMFGFDSQIAMCRAMGRGAARGEGREPHRLDVQRSAWEQRHDAMKAARLANGTDSGAPGNRW